MDELVVDVLVIVVTVVSGAIDITPGKRHERRATYWIAVASSYAYGLVLAVQGNAMALELVLWVAYCAARLGWPVWGAPLAIGVWGASIHSVALMACATPLVLHGVYYDAFLRWWFTAGP